MQVQIRLIYNDKTEIKKFVGQLTFFYQTFFLRSYLVNDANGTRDIVRNAPQATPAINPAKLS